MSIKCKICGTVRYSSEEKRGLYFSSKAPRGDEPCRCLDYKPNGRE